MWNLFCSSELAIELQHNVVKECVSDNESGSGNSSGRSFHGMILSTHVSTARKANECFAPLLTTPSPREAKELAENAEAEAIKRAPTENFILLTTKSKSFTAHRLKRLSRQRAAVNRVGATQ